MARFKSLDKYANNLTETASVGIHYQGEVGTSGVREDALKGVVGALKKAMAAARNNQVANRTPQSTDVKGVKNLAAFHTGQQTQNKTAEQSRLNDRVIWLRKWLSRQGAWFSGLDDLNWPQTMRLKVVYDAELRQQNATEITIVGGRLFTSNGQPLDTAKMVTHFSGPGFGIYVMSNTGRLYVQSHSVGHYHHSSLLAGSPVACAGELKVTNGIMSWLSNKSGHYTPGRGHLLQVLGMLQTKGSDLSFSLDFMSANGKVNYINVESFMVAEMLDDANFAQAQMAVSALLSNLSTYEYNGGNSGGYIPGYKPYTPSSTPAPSDYVKYTEVAETIVATVSYYIS